jgi:glycosyltransferase involved in cell wall biosynthesis
VADGGSNIAVAIPVYNGSAYLAEAINSALVQTLKPAEISIIDDASNDQTPAVIAKFADRAEIRAQRLADRLPAPGAWNAAVRSTTASHLVLLAHDDVLDPAFCREAQNVLDAVPDTDIIAFGHQDMKANGELGQVHTMSQSGLPIGAAISQDGYLDRFCAGGQFFLPSAVVMSRRIFDRVNGFDEQLKVAYDWDFYLRAGAGGAKIVLMDQVLCRYRLHPAQSVQSYTRRDNGDNAIIFQKLTELQKTLADRHIRMLVNGMCDFMRNMVSAAVRDPAVSADEVLQTRDMTCRTLTEWSRSPLPQGAYVTVAPRPIKRTIMWELSGSRFGIGLLRRMLGVGRAGD